MLQLLRNWTDRYLSDPQIVILGLVLSAGFLMMYMLGDMLTPVFIAVVIAYLLEGLVGLFARIRLPRRVSVFVVFFIFIACLLLVLIWLLPLLSRQIGQFIQDLPAMIAKGQKALMRLPETYPEFISRGQIDRFLIYLDSELTSLGQRLLSLSLASVQGLITMIVYLILVPLMVFFFLKDKELILGWFEQHLPENRALVTRVWQEVNQQISNYVRGKMWEIIIVWGVTWAAFSMLHLKYAMLLSFFTGLSVLIPYIGATLMTLPVALIAFFQWGPVSQFTYTLIAYGIIQALDGNLLVPLLLSEVVNLHPVAIIVSLLVFGGLWGIWGLFFAIPLATLFHAVIKAWQVNQEANHAPPAEETPTADG